MRYATGAKMLGCTVVGATLLLGGAGALGGLDMAMAQSSLLPVETMQRNAVDYDKVANVSGDFTFCQDVVTPADEVFNLFGTATTALCAKPGYAFDAVTHESYYLNIGGNVEKVYTVGLDEIERMDSKIQKMRCTCGMSPALAMASVKGVKVSDMLSMTDIAPEVNTITFKDKDGYGLPMPLSYVLAKYFTRAVTDIELSVSDEVPEVQGPDDEYRAKVNILSTVDGGFKVGDMVSFEGYADDCGVKVASVEFSMDGGETWTSFDTSSSNAEDWVYWHFDYVAETAGTFKLDVRAVTEDGTVSPLASSVVFDVEA